MSLLSELKAKMLKNILPVVSKNITIETPDSKIDLQSHEHQKRKKELVLALVVAGIVGGLTLIQMLQLGTGSFVFIALFCLNVILLLGVLFVVLRNGIKLLLERRRGVLGSHLRTRLVLAFASMTLIPCLVMAIVTGQFVKHSIDFWFKNQVENTMDIALEVGRNSYDKAGKRLQKQAEYTLDEIKDRRLTWSGTAMNTLLERKGKEYNLALAGMLSPDLNEQNWHASPALGNSWASVKNSTNWVSLGQNGYSYILGIGPYNDFMYGILPVDGGKSGFIILAEDMGVDFKANMDRIAVGTEEYKQLRVLRSPLKSMLYITLGVLTSLITLGIIWFAFRVAKEISAPIMALIEATEQVAKGDLSVRLEDIATDELGLLTRSFNLMAEDLDNSRKEITSYNSILEQQNLRLEEHHQYVETILNNIAAGVITIDTNWNITTVNNAACEILNIPLELLQNKHLGSLVPAHYAKLAIEAGTKLLRKPEMRLRQQFTLHINGEDRRLMVNAVGMPSVNNTMQGTVAVFEDITDLERMQRMSAWREVAKRIAHEIKNPLTPIKLSAQRLERKFSAKINDPVFVQSTQLIVREVEHLQYMVQEFSAFAKLPEISPIPMPLLPIVQELAETFDNSHSRIRWIYSVPEGAVEHLQAVPLDKAAMHRALMNILTNAAEALENTENPEVRISVKIIPSLEMLRIDIADNGPGLSEDERSKIFEPYFSKKKGGTGLGLAIVKSIITDHHGYIRVNANEKSKGLVVTIELPLT